MHLTVEVLQDMAFQPVRKVVLLQARALTIADYEQCDGMIHTLEGIARFLPGDYLARGIQQEEWPITRRQFFIRYEQVRSADINGFALYRARNVYEACQILQPFTLQRANGDILQGKAGDYILRSGLRHWIVDQTIFAQTYQFLSNSSAGSD